MRVPQDQLHSFNGVLVNFSEDPVEVRGYADLQTTFSDESATKTIIVRYIVVKAPSSYNLLLGQPSLNFLEAIVSITHLKVKFLTNEGEGVTLRVDQAIARKCYKYSLKMHRYTYVISLVI